MRASFPDQTPDPLQSAPPAASSAHWHGIDKCTQTLATKVTCEHTEIYIEYDLSAMRSSSASRKPSPDVSNLSNVDFSSSLD